jgi:hypothetical protein
MHRSLLPIFLALVAGGCAKPVSTISGAVTLDGKPLEQGTITFHPADGKGTASSTEIADGRYSLDNVPAGPKIVEVSATQTANFPRSNEEMAKQFAEAKAKGKKAAAVESADLITLNTTGNNRKIEIQPGKQEVNIPLEGKKPGNK